MSHPIESYVVHEARIEDHRTDELRSGEGCVEVLPDGSLLMIYGKFEGGRDASPAHLVARQSHDGGITWTDREMFQWGQRPAGSLNVMSVSLLRLADGRLACMWLQKDSLSDCRPRMSFSRDGQSWSQPICLFDRPGYYVVNNDRLVQLTSGRLLVPYCYYRDIGKSRASVCGCGYSDDGGVTWQLGREQDILKHNVLPPRHIDRTNPAAVEHIDEGRVAAQEPGVIELRSGQVLMWVRSTGGYAYQAVSSDGGQTFEPFRAIDAFSMPCGPQSIKRLPGRPGGVDNGRLIMLFNDRGDIPFGHPQFEWRRPLTVAVSDDDGQTWQRQGLLESDLLPTHCYYSICFHRENVVMTYYEGVMRTNEQGLYVPRNLASLKLKVVKRTWFEL